MKNLEIRECCYNCKVREVTPSKELTERVSYCKKLQDVIACPEKYVCNLFEPTSDFIANFNKFNARKRINFREVKDE